MTLNFEYTADELRDAERWRPGMGPVWRSIFAAIYLLIALVTLVVGLSGARTDLHRTIGRAAPGDVLRHLKNVGLLLLPMLWWMSGLAALVVAACTGRFSRRNRYIDDSGRVPRRSTTRAIVWIAFILMMAAHELFTSFNPARLKSKSVDEQIRDRLPGVSLALVVCAVGWPLVVNPSIAKARGQRHGLGRPKQIEIDEKGITFADPVSMFHSPWFRIRAIVEAPCGYLVFDKPTSKTLRLIPRHGFLTPDHEVVFRQTVFNWAAMPVGGFEVVPMLPPLPVVLE